MLVLCTDDLLGSDKIAELKSAFQPQDLLELNFTRLDGQKLAPGDLAQACNAMPFMADRRLVVVDRLASQFENKRSGNASPDDSPKPRTSSGERAGQAEAFADLLADLPDSVDLVLVESSAVSPSNPILLATRANGGTVVESSSLRGERLRQWVIDRTRAKGGKIGAEAADDLALAHAGSLRALDNDIEKLVLFAHGELITENDVAQMVGSARTSNIFTLVDAIGAGNRRMAFRVLRELQDEGEPAIRTLAMISRQFRLLVQAKEMKKEGATRAEIGAALGVGPSIADRVLHQSETMGFPQLERAYAALVETDLSIKTGRMDAEVALEMITLDLCTQRRRN